MREAPEVKWVFMVVVIGALYMVKTKSTSLGNEEQLSANGIKMAEYNATRLANQTIGGSIYETLSNWTGTTTVPTLDLQDKKPKLKPDL